MTARDVALTDTVFAATTLCPRIVRNAIKAKYGAREERLLRLQEAKRLVLELAVKLELAEAAAKREAARIAETAS